MMRAQSDPGLVLIPFGGRLNPLNEFVGMLKQEVCAVSEGECRGGGPDGSVAGSVGVIINCPE